VLIVPAIDLRGGKVVRLVKGDFNQETIFAEDPLAVAKRWVDAGAKRLHLIDLDGARTGVPHHLEIVEKIARAIRVPVQVGGGVRTLEVIGQYLELGVAQVILGTKACSDEEFLAEALRAHKEKIAVGVDVKEGRVATEGWLKKEAAEPMDLVDRLLEQGVKTIIYTDVARDGTMIGPAMESCRRLLKKVKSRAAVFASGGVSSLDDLLRLKELEASGLSGVVVGRALYEGTIDLKEAVKRC